MSLHYSNGINKLSANSPQKAVIGFCNIIEATWFENYLLGYF